MSPLMRAPISRHRDESTRADCAAVAQSRHVREQAAREDDLARGALIVGGLTVDGRMVAP